MERWMGGRKDLHFQYTCFISVSRLLFLFSTNVQRVSEKQSIKNQEKIFNQNGLIAKTSI